MVKKKIIFLGTSLLSLFFFTCCCSQKDSKVSNIINSKDNITHFMLKIKSEKSTRVLSEGIEDFDLALSAKAPKYALVGAASLNGITNYKGNGYTLQIVDTEAMISGNVTHIYGAILEFNDPDFNFLHKQISDVKLYDHDKYLSLKK